MGKGNATDLTRRALLSAALASAGSAAWAGGPLRSIRPVLRPESLSRAGPRRAADLIRRARLSGRFGLILANARSGEILDSHNPVKPMPPASVTKALTAQYALETLGPAHRFTTRILATGKISDGRLEGDLMLLGGGDPELDTAALAEMARALAESGLREIAGRFLVCSGALAHVDRIDPAQPDYLGYNPAVCGLNLNYNRVHFEWRRKGEGWMITMQARAENYRPDVHMASMRIADRRYPVYEYAREGSRESWSVARGALGRDGARWLPVRSPELYAGDVLRTLAGSEGIALPAPTMSRDPLPGRTLVAHESAPLSEILRDMLKYSTNLTAEVVGLSSSLARGHNPRNLAQSAAVMTGWLRAEMALRRPYLVNHSGLSDRARLTAADMVAALLGAGPDSTLAGLMKPMRIRDGQGNLAPDSPLRLQAKTGTLNFVSALAGYLYREGRDPLAFAIFAADPERRARIRPEERERPRGAKGWNNRAVRLKWQILDFWGRQYLA